MPRTYKSKSRIHYTNQAIVDALVKRRELGSSWRQLSKDFNVPKTVLLRHDKSQQRGSSVSRRGRLTVFAMEEELELRNCIIDLADIGFAPTLSDIKEIVHGYVVATTHARALETFKYKGVKGFPGPDWLTKFMERQNLSLKNATKLSKARRDATENPFIINHWYDLLEETIHRIGLEDRPDLIWNSDESGLPHEPKKCKVVSLRGQKTLQVVTGSDRDNTTVLAAVSASGKTIPPMIVFQGKQVQTTWRPSTPADSEFYPWIFANEKGWMNGDTFHKWYVEWEKLSRSYTDDGDLEPRLHIYDGHLSHVNYETVKLSREQNITILKLPPQTTDTLQPLDVSVFKSLKEKWGTVLFQRLRKTRSALSKSEFSTTISSDSVWKASFNEDGIKNGFRRCGIWPVDRTQYPVTRFNLILKNRYDTWVAEGKNPLTSKELDAIFAEARVNSTADQDANQPATYQGRPGRMVTYFLPDDDPNTMVRVDSSYTINTTPSERSSQHASPSCSSLSTCDKSTPVGTPAACSSSSSTPLSTSFKEQCLKRLDNKPYNQPKIKRRNVNPYGVIVTSDETFEAIFSEIEKENEKKESKKKKIEKTENERPESETEMESETEPNESENDFPVTLRNV